MNSQDDLKADSDKRKREYILKFMRERNLISHEGNLINSPKAFLVYAVLRLCLDKAEKKQISQTVWDKYHKTVNQYIAGIVDLEWDEKGKLKVIEVEYDSTR
jgi:hypothetical protein